MFVPPKNKVDQVVEDFEEHASSEVGEDDKARIKRTISMGKVVSTGSTLLDLAICGRRVRGGGLPGGIIVEIFGPSGTGKTLIATEIATSVQTRGGEVKFLDPEARLDRAYAELLGLSIKDKFFDYHRPDTVSEMFDKHIFPWQPSNPNVINACCADSLAAFSTELELEKGDKMGMRRGKEFSQGLRKTARKISKNDWIIVCTNQIRFGEKGKFTPGGMGIPFYASVRIELYWDTPAYITGKGKLTIAGKERTFEKEQGINVVARVVKNSADDPFRKAPLRILFRYGVDDIGANLQYIKDVTGDTMYDALGKRYKGLMDACRSIENRSLQKNLRKLVITYWEQIETVTDISRAPKDRI